MYNLYSWYLSILYRRRLEDMCKNLAGDIRPHQQLVPPWSVNINTQLKDVKNVKAKFISQVILTHEGQFPGFHDI